MIYGAGNEDTNYYNDDEPVYLNEDNITTPSWLSTPHSTLDLNGGADVDKITALPNTSTSIPVTLVHDGGNGSLSSATPSVIPPWEEGAHNGNRSNLNNTEKQPVDLGNASNNMSEVFEDLPTPHLNNTSDYYNNSEALVEFTNTTSNTMEDSPKFARLETSTETSNGKEKEEENFSNLMRLAPGIPRMFYILSDIEEKEEKMGDAENGLRTEAIPGMRRNKRKVVVAQNIKSPQNELTRTKNNSPKKSTAFNYEKEDDFTTTKKKEVMEIKELDKENMTSNLNTSNQNVEDHKALMNQDDEELPLKRVKRMISDYGEIGVNDAYYLPLYHPSNDDEDDNFMTYNHPPDHHPIPEDQNTPDNTTTLNNSTLDDLEEDWMTKMVFPTAIPYNISTTDRDAFWAHLKRVATGEGSVEATLEPSVVREENVTSEEGLTELPMDPEECFVMVCEGEWKDIGFVCYFISIICGLDDGVNV